MPAADGTLFYNEVATPASPYVVRRVSADGMNAQVVPISLPSPGYPQVSRDGRRLLVTSSDPGRPFKISTNVYAVDLGTLTAVRVTNFEDEVRLTDGVPLTGELGNLGTFILGNRARSAVRKFGNSCLAFQATISPISPPGAAHHGLEDAKAQASHTAQLMLRW